MLHDCLDVLMLSYTLEDGERVPLFPRSKGLDDSLQGVMGFLKYVKLTFQMFVPSFERRASRFRRISG
ncbi:hypothetical protein E4U58_006681, partial [Claviceps cyperi]